MRLSPERVKAAILDSDQEVREAAVYYFATGYSTDPTVMPLVIEAIEKHGWKNAFEAYSFMDDLVQTEETVSWLIRQLETRGIPTNEQEAEPVLACLSALLQADACLLQRHEAAIMELEALDGVSREAVSDVVGFLAFTPAELWQNLEEFCQVQDEKEVPNDEDLAFAYRLVEALARHPDDFTADVLSVLSDDHGGCMVGLAARLAGDMKLEAAVPSLLDLLEGAGDWLHGECCRALVKIGADAVVAQLAERWPAETWEWRMSAACIMEDLHSDLSVQTCRELLQDETDPDLQCRLHQAVLMNFATEGIEPARQFLLETPLDPEVLEVRSALLTACKVTGERFPEFEEWREDSKNDEAFRREWYAEHLPIDEEEDDDWDEGFDEDLTDEEADEDEDSFIPPPRTYVRESPRIGRNDPCPCGSGKKYKKCCYGKGNGWPAADLDDAASIGTVQARSRFPVGTVASYGPDERTTTKIVAGVIKREGAEPILRRWVGTNVKDNPKVKREMQQFFAQHGVLSVAATEGNLGCPHEEGADFPVGEDCPFCPFWRGKQGTARRS